MHIFLVGGAVRDKLLSFPIYDHDWVVVGATPQQMLDQGFKPVGSDFPVFLHPTSHEEYALARTERKSGKGYKGFNYHASPDVTLEQDLIRRDLTINAMAMDDNGNIFDPYNGQKDLENHLLRHVSPAFSEDPLRVLRVARFAARYHHLGFTVADETLNLMTQLSASDELSYLSMERVWQEIERAISEPNPEVFFQLLVECGAAQTLFPLLSNVTEPLGPYLKPLSSIHCRFAVLLFVATRHQSSSDAINTIKGYCEKMKVPNAFRDLALQCRQWAPVINHFSSIDGEQRLALIRSMDLLKRPERLTELAQSAAAIFGDQVTNNSQQVLALLPKLNAIEPKVLMAEGFKGKALGEELKLRQQKVCQ